MTDTREKEIYRTTLVGSVANLVLMALKFVAGILGHSAAMIADAVHSLSDLVTDLVVLMMVRLSSRPRDVDHNYGHGKYETLATAIIGLSLLAVGVMIFYEGAVRIWGAFHGESLEAPGRVALLAAVVSIIVKEALYRFTVAKSRNLESKAMEANAWHHRSDAFSSIAAALGIGGAMLLGPHWRVLDPIAAMAVSVLIVKVAIELLVPAVNELLEKSLPPEEERRILEILAGVPQISDPHNLRTRRIGATRSIEVHVRMPGQMTVQSSHELTRQSENLLRREFGDDTIVNIHVEPLK